MRLVSARGSNPDSYLFWDGFHPTAKADAILAKDFAQTQTPEPSSIVLVGTALAGALTRLRRRRSA